MAKLYPPIISGTLPAFYLETSNLDRIIKITVPFTMNRAVSAVQVKGFALKIKTVQNSEYLYTVNTYDTLQFNLEDSSYVNFILKTSNNSSERELLVKTLKMGLFYKIQIAYIDQNDEIGNFSTVGISKYTTKPEVKIKELSVNETNNHVYTYTGTYDQKDGDSTERVYSYCFNIYDNDNIIIASSGEKIHNSTTDTELNFSYDIFNYMKDFEINKPHRIQYIVTTNNNLVVASPLYRISQKIVVDSDLKADLMATANFEDGYIQLNLIGHKDELNNETITTGSFILSRASESDNYMNWEKLSTFKLIAELPTRELWKDFTAEQGRKYKYSLQQYNDQGLYSSRVLSNEVFSDFEDAFLYDGKCQLKIRYNPKIGNIKTNLSESKIDTLGSKYPFFFRNSEINYKEFTIAGLLSYLADDNFFFITKEELLLEEEKHRHSSSSKDNINDPVSQNIMRERLFKSKVLDWLNNGEPKLFRSPYEGNFIIRLMKVSLSPENKLGRLLHNFNCTAYEVDSYNYDNLVKYNFTHVITNDDIKFLHWKTVEFIDKDANGNIVYPVNKVLNEYPTNNIKIMGMRAGQKISLTFENNNTEVIVIGVTGSYSLNSEMTIREIKLLESNLTYTNNTFDPYLTGSLTYGFFGTTPNEFSKVTNVKNVSYPARQFVGEHSDILQEIKCVNYNGLWLENPKTELINIFNIKCRKRNIEEVIAENNKYYQNNIEYIVDEADRSSLILVGEFERVAPYYNPIRTNWKFIPSYYKDIFNNQIIDLEDYNPTISINGNVINVEDSINFEFNKPDEIYSLSCGNGVVVEVTYLMRETDFNIEDNVVYADVYEAKRNYLNAKNKLDRYYEISGILGSYQGSSTEVQSYQNTLEAQLLQDQNAEKQLYEDKKTSLITSYGQLKSQNATYHADMVKYLEEKISALRNNPLNTPEYWNELNQYEQALYVENYEYERQSGLRKNEYQKQLNALDAKISEIETRYAKEINSIREQAMVQLASITQQKNESLSEIATEYGIQNLEENMEMWYALEDNLIYNVNATYSEFINGLIISQRIEKEGEETND